MTTRNVISKSSKRRGTDAKGKKCYTQMVVYKERVMRVPQIKF